MTTDTGLEGTKTAKVNGTTLAYREQGEGEPVVFVHGGISDLRAWEHQLPAVGGSYRAITYSRRYARPNEPIDPQDGDPVLTHIDDLAAFLAEIDARPAHLVGNSWGALICLLTALRHPDAVRTLTLEEPPAVTLFAPTIPPRPVEMLRLLATRPRTAIDLIRFVLGTITPAQKAFERGEDDEGLQIFARGVMGKKPLDQLPEEAKQQMRDNRNDLRAMMLHPQTEVPRLDADGLGRMQAPVLLVTGELSPDFLLRVTDRLEELLPNTERVEIPGASHVMHVEDPAATNRAILEFLGRHRQGA